MNNLEKYYDKLINSHGVNKTTKRVMHCTDLRCIECIFGTDEGECLEDLVLESPLIWLNKEAKKYIITIEELTFLNVAHTGYLYRDSIHKKLIYKHPMRDSVCLDNVITSSFDFITPDKGPIYIGDILDNYILKER